MASKSLLDEAEKQLVSSLKDWIDWVDGAMGNARAITPPQEKGATSAGNVVFWLEKLRNSLDSTRTSIERVTDILNARKAALEVKRIVVESWPRKAFVDRMAYVSTALFGIGGAPFALTAGQVTSGSLTVAGVLWAVAATLMAWSLREIRREDDAKRRYFEKEFGIAAV